MDNRAVPALDDRIVLATPVAGFECFSEDEKPTVIRVARLKACMRAVGNLLDNAGYTMVVQPLPLARLPEQKGVSSAALSVMLLARPWLEAYRAALERETRGAKALVLMPACVSDVRHEVGPSREAARGLGIPVVAVENLLGMSRSELVGILGRAEENATRKIPVARSGARGRASRGR